MPRLVQFYIRQVIAGFGLSALFVAGLLTFDVAGLGHLVANSADGALAVFLLWMFNGIVFAGVQFGIAVMLLGRDEDPRGGTRDPVAIPVRRDERVMVRRDHHGR